MNDLTIHYQPAFSALNSTLQKLSCKVNCIVACDRYNHLLSLPFWQKTKPGKYVKHWNWNCCSRIWPVENWINSDLCLIIKGRIYNYPHRGWCRKQAGSGFEPEFVGHIQLLGHAYTQDLKEIRGCYLAVWGLSSPTPCTLGTVPWGKAGGFSLQVARGEHWSGWEMHIGTEMHRDPRGQQ